MFTENVQKMPIFALFFAFFSKKEKKNLEVSN